MISAAFDLIGKYAIEKGFPWAFRFTRYAGLAKTPVDLTGQQCRLDIYDAFAPASPILSVSTASGEVVLGGATGAVAIDLSAVQTSFTATHLRYRLVFIDVLQRERVFMRGRLGLLENGL